MAIVVALGVSIFGLSSIKTFAATTGPEQFSSDNGYEYLFGSPPGGGIGLAIGVCASSANCNTTTGIGGNTPFITLYQVTSGVTTGQQNQDALQFSAPLGNGDTAVILVPDFCSNNGAAGSIAVTDSSGKTIYSLAS